MTPETAGRQSFLFLQGPHGPFFHRLGCALRDAGHQVVRMNFCGGDRYDWPGPAIDFIGRLSDLMDRTSEIIAEMRITDLVLFGDCRPVHRMAIDAAMRRGIRVWAFEEGYIRPDYLTLELGGVNGNSQLSTDRDDYLKVATDLAPMVPHPPVPSSLTRRLRQAGMYTWQTYLQCWRFRHYTTHRPVSPLIEAIGWANKLRRRRRVRAAVRRQIDQLADVNYVLFPLQLETDYQVRLHSHFASVSEAIDVVIHSFAENAPFDLHLVCKTHPLDNGLTNWSRVVARIAAMYGVTDRVRLLDGGDIAKLVRCATGLVTINSTSGTLALSCGIPTKVLGRSVYDIEGITHRGSLDHYWIAPSAPDPVTWDAFCRVLLDRSLIHGGLLSDEGIEMLIRGALERLTRVTAHHMAPERP